MTLRRLILFICIGASTFHCFGQDEESDEDIFKVEYDSPLTIDLDEEIEKDEESLLFSGKNKKKKVFYGLKTKKGFTRKGYGKKLVIERFHFLKNYKEPPPYVQDIYWYNYRRKKIVKSKAVKQGEGFILHGPYEKTINATVTVYEMEEQDGKEVRVQKKITRPQVIESGVFYLGTKHARWTRWNKNDILMSKEKWYKGWPKASKVAYYNKEKRIIKEIIPIEGGKKNGHYYAFHENGAVAAQGKYQHDSRIGKWYEYYDFKGRKKKEVQYPKDAFTDQKPKVLREWNKKGRLTYDYKKEKRK